MLQILVIKMVECGKDRVRRCLSESAEGSVLYHLAQSGKCLEVLFGTLAVSYLVQGLQKTLVADTARGTFAAGLLHCEIQIKPCDRDHTVILVHDNHSSRAHHRAFGKEIVEIYRYVKVFFRKASSGRASGLHRLEFLATLDASSYLVDDLAQCSAHRHLYQTYIVDFSGKGKHFGSLGFLSAY